MLLSSHISANTRCVAEKVCGLVRSGWGTSQGEDKLGARDKILNTKVARRACARQTFPQQHFQVVVVGKSGDLMVVRIVRGHANVLFSSYWITLVFFSDL